MAFPRTFNHPTFGPCSLVSGVIAIKWRQPLDQRTIESVLDEYSLTFATDAPKPDRAAPSGRRDPRALNVNQSRTLTWATGTRLTDTALRRISAGSYVEWVTPAYRA